MSGQDPRHGIILDQWSKAVPIFHRLAPFQKEWPAKTACGRNIGAYAAWLQMRHLKSFARRCKGCWPR